MINVKMGKSLVFIENLLKNLGFNYTKTATFIALFR